MPRTSGSVALRVALDSGRVVRIVVDNVLYHERFSSNLLSSELLTQEAGLAVPQHPGGHVRRDARGRRVTLSTRGRVAVLMSAGPERVHRVAPSRALPHRVAIGDAGVDALVRLHERLDHMRLDAHDGHAAQRPGATISAST